MPQPEKEPARDPNQSGLNRLIFEKMGLTFPAVLATELCGDFKFDNVLNTPETELALTRGVKLAEELRRTSTQITSKEVLDLIETMIPEYYVGLKEKTGEPALEAKASEFLGVLSKMEIKQPLRLSKTSKNVDSDNLLTNFTNIFQSALGLKPALATPEGINLPQVPEQNLVQFELKDYITEEIQGQKVKPLIAAMLVFGTSLYFSLSFIAKGTGLPNAEGWLAGVLINAWESFGLDVALTEPKNGPTKGDLLMTSLERKKIKAIFQRILLYSIPIAYLLDAAYTGVGIFEKYPLADGSQATVIMSVLGRIFISGLVAVAPEISLNAISKYLSELLRGQKPSSSNALPITSPASRPAFDYGRRTQRPITPTSRSGPPETQSRYPYHSIPGSSDED